MTLADFFDDHDTLTVPAGESILHQGDDCRHYFLVVSGSARVFTRSAGGREVVLYHINPGNVCILTTTCILGNRRFPAEAAAETGLTIRMMPRQTFEALMKSSPEFREQVFATLSGRIGDLIARIEKLTLETLETRLIKYLLEQPTDEIDRTHQAIASEVGSAREVVSRHLKRLETQGLITLGRNCIRITDRHALDRLIQIKND